MMSPLLMLGSLFLAAPNAGVAASVQFSPPSILTGRKRGYLATQVAAQDREIADGKPVPVRCKVFAPAIFSGRVPPQKCELEVIRPGMATVAPAIFSGRSPKRGNVIVGAAAYAIPVANTRQTHTDPATGQSYATDPVTGQSYAAYPEKTYNPQPKRRAPSIFSGRRARRAPATGQ